MAELENTAEWTLTSTGASTQISLDFGGAQFITIHADCAGNGDTCAFGIEAAANADRHFTRMGSTAYSISSGESAIVQMTGPLGAIRPYIIAKNAATTVVRISLLAN